MQNASGTIELAALTDEVESALEELELEIKEAGLTMGCHDLPD